MQLGKLTGTEAERAFLAYRDVRNRMRAVGVRAYRTVEAFMAEYNAYVGALAQVPDVVQHDQEARGAVTAKQIQRVVSAADEFLTAMLDIAKVNPSTFPGVFVPPEEETD